MDNTLVVINEEPYLIWEVDLIKRNLEFLNSIQPEYFEYLIKAHSEIKDETEDKWAAIALRIGYFQALETLFSLIGAFLQSPRCVYAWISKCSTQELRTLISRINRSDQSLFTSLNIERIDWHSISQAVFRAYLPDTEKNQKTVKCFASLWQRLSYEFLDDRNIEEYNSLKHGLRVKPGGFGLSVGLEHQEGFSPPQEEMQTIAFSKYGTTFFCLEKIGGDLKTNRSFRSRRVSKNWEIEKVILLLQLIAVSIKNLLATLLIINGVKQQKVKFHRPIEDADFEKPWIFSSGVKDMSMDFVIEDYQCRSVTKEELLKMVEEVKANSKSKEQNGRC